MPEDKMINIRFGRLFPWPFLIVAVLVIPFSLILMVTKPLLSGLLLLLCVAVLTADEGTTIDVTAKRFREYTSVFFIKSGKWTTFHSIERFFVNQSRLRQRMYTARTSHAFEYVFHEFNVFVKFDNGEKVRLIRGRNKERLMRRAADVSRQFDVPLIDNTQQD